jgi:hypothetical protein
MALLAQAAVAEGKSDSGSTRSSVLRGGWTFVTVRLLAADIRMRVFFLKLIYLYF